MPSTVRKICSATVLATSALTSYTVACLSARTTRVANST
jgi:hypothetical protein